MRVGLSTSVALTLLLACSNAKAPSGVTLCGQFVSGWTPLRAEQRARELGLGWSARVRERYEGLEIIEAELSGFEELGSSGELTLHFYNEELSTCYFYPVNFVDYVKRLSDEHRVKDAAWAQGVNIGGAHVWVWDERQTVWKDEDRRFVGWRDDEILRQHTSD